MNLDDFTFNDADAPANGASNQNKPSHVSMFAEGEIIGNTTDSAVADSESWAPPISNGQAAPNENPQAAPQQPGESTQDYAARIQALEQENQRLRDYEQLGRLVETDPDLYDTINNYLVGGSRGQQPEPAAPQEPELVRPQLPEDPYDHEAFRTYNEQLLEYNEQLAERKARSIASEQIQQFQQQIQQQQAQMQQQQALSGQLQEIQQKYKVAPESIQEFQQWAADPKNVSMENVFKLYQLSNGQLNGQPQQPVLGQAGQMAPQQGQPQQPQFNPYSYGGTASNNQPMYPQPLANVPGGVQPTNSGPSNFYELFSQFSKKTSGQDLL